MRVGLVFPHQLFEANILVETCEKIYLIEEFLFFKQYNFHKQKLAYHRGSMKFYEEYLQTQGIIVTYVEATNTYSDIRKLIPHLKDLGTEKIEYYEPTDNWLSKRIAKHCQLMKIIPTCHESPMFLNDTKDLNEYFSNQKRMFQTDFYKFQRKKRNYLIDNKQQPIGGKWSFDDENRLKYPKGKVPPSVKMPKTNKYSEEAHKYVEKHFSDNIGELNANINYPLTFEDSKIWLNEFFEKRFSEFGHFEDAILVDSNFMQHSVLSPMLNTGLLTPKFIVDEAIKFAHNNQIPINSLEGFIRQIVGWREFIRGVYSLKGNQERTNNYWKFSKKIPKSFWDGTTGIDPIDITIKKILKTGYCHHIERLMVLGNFMLLCEFDPDEVYQWFMELFIDSYDWVMVPNVYGMSQFADGGIFATKPYISGSNYLMKMSDYPKGEWQKFWDGLFWRFMDKHRSFFSQNPRLNMLIHSFDKMKGEKKIEHLGNAEHILDQLK